VWFLCDFQRFLPWTFFVMWEPFKSPKSRTVHINQIDYDNAFRAAFGSYW